jgi:hypothetical protein
MTPSAAEQAMYEDLMSIYARAGAEVTYETESGEIKPYWAKRYLSALKRADKRGELLEFVERLAGAPEPSRGFLILKKARRLDLTLEALVCDRSKRHWDAIDPQVVQIASERLTEHGYETEPVRKVLQARRSSMRVRDTVAAKLDDDADGLQAREQTIALLRTDDEIGVRELVLSERRRFWSKVLDDLQDAGDRLGRSAEPDDLHPVEQSLWSHVERRLGTLLALLEYRPRALDEDWRSLAALAEEVVPTTSTVAEWRQGTRWPVWLVTLIAGAAAVTLERPDVVMGMWRRRTRLENRPLPVIRLENAAVLGAALLRARPGRAQVPELWYPAFAVWDSDLLREHYPEIMRVSGTPDAVHGFLSRAGDFLWLCDALAGRDGVEASHLYATSQVHPTLAARLVDNPELRGRYAVALGEDPENLIASLNQWIST